MTASMISSTDEFGDVLLRRDRPRRVAGAERERRDGDRQEDPQRAEDRHDLQDDHAGTSAPSRASRIFDVPDALARLDRLERDVVARLDERQRRRRRRREAVRQQVEELAQALAARAAEAGRQIRNLAPGQVAREPVQRRVAERGAPASPASRPRARR